MDESGIDNCLSDSSNRESVVVVDKDRDDDDDDDELDCTTQPIYSNTLSHLLPPNCEIMTARAALYMKLYSNVVTQLRGEGYCSADDLKSRKFDRWHELYLALAYNRYPQYTHEANFTMGQNGDWHKKWKLQKRSQHDTICTYIKRKVWPDENLKKRKPSSAVSTGTEKLKKPEIEDTSVVEVINVNHIKSNLTDAFNDASTDNNSIDGGVCLSTFVADTTLDLWQAASTEKAASTETNIPPNSKHSTPVHIESVTMNNTSTTNEKLKLQLALSLHVNIAMQADLDQQVSHLKENLRQRFIFKVVEKVLSTERIQLHKETCESDVIAKKLKYPLNLQIIAKKLKYPLNLQIQFFKLLWSFIWFGQPLLIPTSAPANTLSPIVAAETHVLEMSTIDLDCDVKHDDTSDAAETHVVEMSTIDLDCDGKHDDTSDAASALISLSQCRSPTISSRQGTVAASEPRDDDTSEDDDTSDDDDSPEFVPSQVSTSASQETEDSCSDDDNINNEEEDVIKAKSKATAVTPKKRKAKRDVTNAADDDNIDDNQILIYFTTPGGGNVVKIGITGVSEKTSVSETKAYIEARYKTHFGPLTEILFLKFPNVDENGNPKPLGKKTWIEHGVFDMIGPDLKHLNHHVRDAIMINNTDEFYTYDVRSSSTWIYSYGPSVCEMDLPRGISEDNKRFMLSDEFQQWFQRSQNTTRTELLSDCSRPIHLPQIMTKEVSWNSSQSLHPQKVLKKDNFDISYADPSSLMPLLDEIYCDPSLIGEKSTSNHKLLWANNTQTKTGETFTLLPNRLSEGSFDITTLIQRYQSGHYQVPIQMPTQEILPPQWQRGGILAATEFPSTAEMSRIPFINLYKLHISQGQISKAKGLMMYYYSSVADLLFALNPKFPEQTTGKHITNGLLKDNKSGVVAKMIENAYADNDMTGTGRLGGGAQPSSKQTVINQCNAVLDFVKSWSSKSENHNKKCVILWLGSGFAEEIKFMILWIWKYHHLKIYIIGIEIEYACVVAATASWKTYCLETYREFLGPDCLELATFYCRDATTVSTLDLITWGVVASMTTMAAGEYVSLSIWFKALQAPDIDIFFGDLESTINSILRVTAHLNKDLFNLSVARTKKGFKGLAMSKISETGNIVQVARLNLEETTVGDADELTGEKVDPNRNLYAVPFYLYSETQPFDMSNNPRWKGTPAYQQYIIDVFNELHDYRSHFIKRACRDKSISLFVSDNINFIKSTNNDQCYTYRNETSSISLTLEKSVLLQLLTDVKTADEENTLKTYISKRLEVELTEQMKSWLPETPQDYGRLSVDLPIPIGPIISMSSSSSTTCGMQLRNNKRKDYKPVSTRHGEDEYEIYSIPKRSCSVSSEHNNNSIICEPKDIITICEPKDDGESSEQDIDEQNTDEEVTSNEHNPPS